MSDLEVDLSTGETTVDGKPVFPATPGPPPPPPVTRTAHRAAPADFTRRAANRIQARPVE